MKISDAFDLVKLDKEFTEDIKKKLETHSYINEDLISRLKEGEELSDIERLIKEQGAEGLYNDNKLVGCVKRAHDIDVNLNAHTIFENLAVKASGVLSALVLVEKNGINPEDVEYVSKRWRKLCEIYCRISWIC